ncbi:MAG: 4'-phosphopantetheinyl transferase superfamily protein [Bacteroides sp.]|nr:4'-phosphopantetheinyl transferase superfamily protein [Ruminococcus flavefaciens]MCM1554354.1 4'-phosphopantetheinyl transferase superfamily protein [Bacteroides sp.]
MFQDMPAIHIKTFPHDISKAERKTLGRAFVLQVLQTELGVNDSLNMARTAQGKPYLAGYPDFFFNYSDSGETLVLATGGSPVGVDVEQMRPRGLEGVLERFFLPEESLPVRQAQGEQERTAQFFLLWTAKESLLKYVGCGLGGEMRRYPVLGGYARYEGKRLRLRTYIVRNGRQMEYTAASVRCGDLILTLCSESEEEPRFIFYPE